MSEDKQERMMEALPIACTLSNPRDIEERRASLDDIFRGVNAKHELADGYEMVFPGDDVWAERLMKFVAMERKCCPFLFFELAFEQASGPIHLRLRGAIGVKNFLDDWLKALA